MEINFSASTLDQLVSKIRRNGSMLFGLFGFLREEESARSIVFHDNCEIGLL